MAKKQKLAPVISILNMKGGVGKTTICANVFREAYRLLERRTLLIDFDPQFNLTQTVMTKGEYETLREQKKTIMSVMEDQQDCSIFDICETSSPPPSPSEVTTLLKRLQKPHDHISLHLIAGDFGLTKYSLLNDEAILARVRERFLNFIQQCREEFDLICIDCNPSSSFMTLCALKACTHLLVPVRPDRYSILGLELLSQFVASVPDLNAAPKKMILLNGVPTSNYDPSVETELRAHQEFGPATLSAYLYTSKVIEAKPGFVGFATDRKAPNRKLIKARIDAVAKEIGMHLGDK